MRSFFTFRRSVDNLGVGTRDLGLEQPQHIQPASMYGPRYNVRRSFGPTAPGFAVIGQRVVPVSFHGSGSGLQGQMILQALAKLERS